MMKRKFLNCVQNDAGDEYNYPILYYSCYAADHESSFFESIESGFSIKIE